MPQLKQYYWSEDEFEKIHQALKLTICPHCRQTGMLIMNGIIYGYPDNSGLRNQVRGHRIYCSNRNNRTGCGRSVGVLCSEFIHGFSLTAMMVWQFLKHRAAGSSKISAFRALGTCKEASTAYRLYGCLHRNLSRIRTTLMRHFSGKAPPRGFDPVCHTFHHLQACFPDSICPVSSFQHTFQVSFL